MRPVTRTRTADGRPAFFPSAFDPEVPLPEGLENEPYAYEDTEFRAELSHTRERFEFRIDEGGSAFCRVGKEELQGPRIERGRRPLPKKRTSNVSVVSVYDVYGLQATYAYLKYLYEVKYDPHFPSWLTTYLRGSLMVLRPGPFLYSEYEGSALLLSSLVLMEIAALDSREPKMLGELRQMRQGELPSEIVSKIVGSRRVSHAVTRRQGEGCDSTPTMQELAAVAGDSEWDVVYLLPNGTYTKAYTDGEPDTWEFTLEPARARANSWVESIVLNPEELHNLTGAIVVQYSLFRYEQVFAARGCDVYDTMIRFLRQLEQRISRAQIKDVDELLGWGLALLGHNPDQPRSTHVLKDFYALREWVLGLVRLTIEDFYGA